jgi:hypothetical protein
LQDTLDDLILGLEWGGNGGECVVLPCLDVVIGYGLGGGADSFHRFEFKGLKFKGLNVEGGGNEPPCKPFPPLSTIAVPIPF